MADRKAPAKTIRYYNIFSKRWRRRANPKYEKYCMAAALIAELSRRPSRMKEYTACYRMQVNRHCITMGGSWWEAQAILLRMQGMSFLDIGKMLYVSGAKAKRMVEDGLWSAYGI